MTNHDYVLIDGIEIDVEMAPLIRSLWKHGFTTEFCCQEIDEGRAHIIFPSTEDAITFTTITRETLNAVSPALIYAVGMAMVPMPLESGRWSVEWDSDWIDIVTDVWEGNDIDFCDCEECVQWDMETCDSCVDSGAEV